MESLTWWTWIWINFGSWWWTGRPGVLQSMGLQRVGHNWATELKWRRAALNSVKYKENRGPLKNLKENENSLEYKIWKHHLMHQSIDRQNPHSSDLALMFRVSALQRKNKLSGELEYLFPWQLYFLLVFPLIVCLCEAKLCKPALWDRPMWWPGQLISGLATAENSD